MINSIEFSKHCLFHASAIGKVVDFNPVRDILLPMDFTNANTALSETILADTDLFSDYVAGKLAENGARYGIGGYNEHRTIYNRSTHFSGEDGQEPRRLHLGVDIWGPVGTPVYNFAAGHIYGFAMNNNFGDYGATIIIKYEWDDLAFYGLYGHLNAASLVGLHEGAYILKGQQFAEFGPKEENGGWPPHLHFQLIVDMQGNKTDYPGVCKFSEREKFLANCPDPMHILRNTLMA